MDIALSWLRSVLLGALGGLGAFALAGWLSGTPPSALPAGQPQAAAPALVRQARLPSPEVDATTRELARRFIAEAAGASLYGAQAASLVRARSADADVQNLAAVLLHSHEAAWPGLQELAQDRGIALPQAPTGEQRATLMLLHDVAEHTRAHLFVRKVGVEGTLSEIARFEAALGALAIADPSLRRWIEQTLPSLRQRAALSQRLLPQVAERRPMA